MKATMQYFPVLLFMLYRWALGGSVEEIFNCKHVKATVYFSPTVIFSLF